MRMTKADVLAEFEVLAKLHYEGDVPGSVLALLPKLVNNGLSDVDVKDGTLADKGYILLTGEITEEMAAGDGEVIDQLYGAHLDLPLDVPITLCISSVGGDVSAAFAIIGSINAIRRDGRKVNAHITGWAHSAAAFIVEHCDYRSADPIASLMLHEEDWAVEGSTSKHATEAQFSRKQIKTICEIIAARTGRPAKYYEEKVRNKDWYLTASEALAEHLIDAIVPVPPLPVSAVEDAPVRRRRKAASEPIVAS